MCIECEPRPQPSTISMLLQSSSSQNIVYRRRRKLTENVTNFCVGDPKKVKVLEDSLSVISTETHALGVKEHANSACEHKTEAAIDSAAPEACFVDHHVLSSTEDHLSCVEDLATAGPKKVDEADEMGECSSSGVMMLGVMGKGLSENEICISLLRNHGVLKRICSNPIGDSFGTAGDLLDSQACRTCGGDGRVIEMLICDDCEAVFHLFCCNLSLTRLPTDEWFCHLCLKKQKVIRGSSSKSSKIIQKLVASTNSYADKLNPILSMLRDTKPYTTGARIGNGFQAEVPDWSGTIEDDVDPIGQPLEMDPSESINMNEVNYIKHFNDGSIGNWLQCKEIRRGAGEDVNGTTCGKWRRAPLFEVQSDNWGCFCSILWDPTHADCAVPQELETSQVVKQLKYIQVLKPKISAMRQMPNHTKIVDCEEV